MKNKQTKSFALDELTSDLIHELKFHFDLKSESEAVTYAIHVFYTFMNKVNVNEIEAEIARRKYYKAIGNKFDELAKKSRK